jgi:hypothetical protein
VGGSSAERSRDTANPVPLTSAALRCEANQGFGQPRAQALYLHLLHSVLPSGPLPRLVPSPTSVGRRRDHGTIMAKSRSHPCDERILPVGRLKNK